MLDWEQGQNLQGLSYQHYSFTSKYWFVTLSCILSKFHVDCECNETTTNKKTKPKVSEFYTCALSYGYRLNCQNSLPKQSMGLYPVWTRVWHLQIAVFSFTNSECNCANSRACATQITDLESVNFQDRFRPYQVFQGRLKGTGEAIAMRKEVAAGIIILAECQAVMFAEIC